jgi:hypothetical protein
MESMFPNLALAGQQGTSESLFGRIAVGSMGPTPEEMERERLRAQFSKHVRFKEYGVKTFNLSHAPSAKAYQELMRTLFEGTQARTHVVVFNDRRFVEQPKARWVAHVEWMEFDVETIPHGPVGTG